MRAKSSLRPMLLLVLIGLALGLAGWGHRLPSGGELQLEAHRLIGLAPELCGDHGPAGGEGHDGLHQPCPVCTQVGTAILPAPPLQLRRIEREYRHTVHLPRTARAAHRPFDPANPQRAPPVPV